MKNNRYSTIDCELHVTGHLWSGPKASHVYRIDSENSIPKSMADAKRIAGDFESLETAKIIITEQEISETTQTRRLKAS